MPESAKPAEYGNAAEPDAGDRPIIERGGFQLLLHPGGAVYLPQLKTWLVADAHFGKAVSFRQLGVPVPRGTTSGTLARLSGLLAAQPSQAIVFLGDFLHSARSHAQGTQASIAQWRASHSDLALTLVRGNHDDRAGDPPASLNIRVVDEPFILQSAEGRLALCHHPQRISGAYVLAGHWHPCVTVSGRAHDRLRLPCFWFGAERADGSSGGDSAGIGILPAFGVFTGMHPIARNPADQVFVVAGDAVRELPAGPSRKASA